LTWVCRLGVGDSGWGEWGIANLASR
jgi:hypothetical protein